MKSIFEEHGGRYIQCGDYLIPELGLTEQEQKPLGEQDEYSEIPADG